MKSKRKYWLVLCAFACIAQLSAQETAVWQNRPSGQREVITGIKGTNKIIILTREGGSLVSSNGGASWQQLDLPSLRYDVPDTRSTNVDSSNIYVMYTTGYVVKADLKGKSSQTIRQPLYHDLNDICFLDDKKGFAVSDMHLIRTTNGGMSWQYLPYEEDGKLVGVTELGAGTKFHKDTIAACTRSGRRIYLGSEKWLAIYFSDAKHGYAVGISTYWNQQGKPVMLKTSDGGNTWTKEKVTFTDKGFHSVHFIGKKIGFIGGVGSTIFKTGDGGTSLQQVYSGDPDLSFSKITFLNETFGYASTNRYMQSEVIFTEDQGKTWQKLDWGTKAWQDLSNDFKDDILKQAGLKPGTWDASTANANSWQTIYNKVNSGSIKFSESYSEKIYTLYSKEDRFRSVYFQTPSIVWAIDSWRGLVFKSVDKGATWTKVNVGNGVTSSDLYSVNFLSNKIGIATGENSTIVRTENGGDTWSNVNVDIKSEQIRNLNFVNAQLGYAKSENFIFKTNDAGKNWTSMKIVVNNKRKFTDTLEYYYSDLEMKDVFFQDETLGLADFAYYRGIRNQCWPPVPNGPACDPVGPEEVHAPAITLDGGKTWQLFNAKNQFTMPNGTVYTYTNTVRSNAKPGENGYYMSFVRSSKGSDQAIVWIPELRKEKVMALKYTETVKQFGVEQMRMEDFNDEFVLNDGTRYLVGKGGRILKVISKK